VTGDFDSSAGRWTVDTPEDLEFVRAVYCSFEPGTQFSWHDVLDLLDRCPEIAKLNHSVTQKTLQG
ncbi:MAG: hypothetical protein WBS19_19925, partial [Candidatus Korobacteraceae bacterium]